MLLPVRCPSRPRRGDVPTAVSACASAFFGIRHKVATRLSACRVCKVVVPRAMPEPPTVLVLPAASFATTLMLYKVLGDKAVSWYDVPATWIAVPPFTLTSYPVTPTLSVLASQERSAEVSLHGF